MPTRSADPLAARSNDVSEQLARRLRAETEGEVLFDPFSRGRYATDASIYQIIHIAAYANQTLAGTIVERNGRVAPGHCNHVFEFQAVAIQRNWIMHAGGMSMPAPGNSSPPERRRLY